MKDRVAVRRLKCALCRRGLLQKYNVYDVPDEGAPVPYAVVSGYFYRKGSRHAAEVLEIAGNIGEQSAYSCRLLIFEQACKTGDLIDVGGSIYKITGIRGFRGVYFLLDLEVWPYAISC